MWRDSETVADYLDFSYLKMILKDIVENEELSPSSIGIYGDWGSGKSSLMNMLKSEFKENNEIVCIKFNGWLFEGYEDAKTSFIGTILDELSSRKEIPQKGKELFTKLYKNIDLLKLASFGIKHGVNYFATGGIGTLSSLIIDSVVKLKEKVSNISQEDLEGTLKEVLKPEELRKSIKEFRTTFNDLLEIIKVKKVVVFIDELDRCNPETIIETLEAVRLFLFTEKTSFIIGADERQVQNAVKLKFKEIEGNGIDIGKEYLEKMIQYPVKIPLLSKENMEKYIICLFLSQKLSQDEFDNFIKIINNNSNKIEFELTYDFIETNKPEIAPKIKEDVFLAKRLGPILSKGLNGNPRHCKRFLNTLIMREKMGKYKGTTLNRDILSKIMILEYFYPYSFNKLSLFLNFEGKLENVKEIENSSEISDNLKEFIVDEKVHEWIKSKPSLSEIDLRPYLYFSRESFGITNNIKYRLSSIAEEIIKGLLSDSDSLEKQSLEKVDIITDVEANAVFEFLKEKIYNNTNIDNKKLTLLIKYCIKRTDQKTSIIETLKEIPADKISFPLFPSLKILWETFNKDMKLTQIIEDWKKSNPKLEKVIENNFPKLKGGH